MGIWVNAIRAIVTPALKDWTDKVTALEAASLDPTTKGKVVELITELEEVAATQAQQPTP